MRGYWQDGVRTNQLVLDLARRTQDLAPQAQAHNHLGIPYERLGRYAEAIACQQESLIIFRALGDRYGEAETLRDLGDALRAVGRDLQARGAWQEALAICEALQIPEADKIRDRLATLPSEVAEPPGSE